jgi:hypothetical protein
MSFFVLAAGMATPYAAVPNCFVLHHGCGTPLVGYYK